jgi:hypothetical protein
LTSSPNQANPSPPSPVEVATGATYGVACEVNPEEAEAKAGTLHCPETAIKEVEQEGKTFKVGLVFGKKAAVFSIQDEIKLTSGEEFGIFQK